jgi:hypothetical protein
MASLYVWLRFVHLVGVGVFLFGHGISGGASLALRARPAAEVSRALLQLSIWSYRISYPGLILVIATGVWMAFAGSWWGRGWIWAAIAVLVVLFGLMSFVSVPYHRARDGLKESETAVAQRLEKARPLLAVWIGAIGILALLFLMVFKPF